MPAAPIARAYVPAVRDALLLPPDRFDNAEAVREAASALPQEAQDRLDALLLTVGAGAALTQVVQPLVSDPQGLLWRCGAVVPNTTVSRGATIDPRLYAGSCRVNPALERRVALPDLRQDDGYEPSLPPSRASWDAVVLAAAVEANPLRLTKSGEAHKEDRKRLLYNRPGGRRRWRLAYEVASAANLFLPDGDVLIGRPEAQGRRLRDPAALFSEPSLQWAARLLLAVRGAWMPLEALATALETRLPTVLQASGFGPRDEQLRRWLRDALDGLHRLDQVDVAVTAEGPVAFRKVQGRPLLEEGFVVSSDLEVFVAPGELERADYGRLCRLAPFVDGDVVHRHRLTEEGLRRDRLEGGEEPMRFLRSRARLPVPNAVAASLQEWQRRAARVVLWSGARVMEVDGTFRRIEGAAPEGARVLRGDPDAPARVWFEDDVAVVPVGADTLRLRQVVQQIAATPTVNDDAWRYPLQAQQVDRPAELQAVLESANGGALPGAVRAVLWGGTLRDAVEPEPAHLIRLPRPLIDALLDDPEAGALVEDVPGKGALAVSTTHLGALTARLKALGLSLQLGPAGAAATPR